MTTTKHLEKLAKTYLSPALARRAKRLAVFPRYQVQARACRRGYQRYGAGYPHQVLFIAGLPKSGTTWLEKMIASYPGYHDLLIPDVAAHELVSSGSHAYELPPDMFDRFRDMLVLTKMHVHGSRHNVNVLRDAGVKYVVLYRDLRDVAVSYLFYVRQTPWHPEYSRYARLSIPEALYLFGETLLSTYVDWVRSWHTNRDPGPSLELRYEDLLANTERIMTEVARHFGLDSSPPTIQSIVAAHRFNKLSNGRDQGQPNDQSFFRNGMAGDWKNHFTPELKQLYKPIIADFLIEFEYETDDAW